ncbi:MAG: ABC transporter ATP-binding protein [Firmicutes bacterium CAG:552_39_19]|nr:MAG: ABC transporter ATP-binding protein [Firmicutes bacterium CAG:552_39_19]
MSLVKTIQKKTASSKQGAKGIIKGIIACAFQNMAFMLPTTLLYFLVSDMLGGGVQGGRITFYVVGCVICFALIFLTTWFQYNNTYFTTYEESGKRRLSLAERLRKLPLSFFGKRDLADLTSTIMSDCEVIEKSTSHFIPGLFGSLISTILIAAGLFVFDWRMALAALWVIPVSVLIVILSYKVQDKVLVKFMTAKMSCADGIQEYIETVRDLKANNAEGNYLSGLKNKIKGVEKSNIKAELTTAVFVTGAGMVLKLGIATVALVGSALLVNGTLGVLTFFMFLLVASRLYDPMQAALQNLAAIIAMRTNVARMNEILEYPVQTGNDTLTNSGYDVVFDHVGFAYPGGEVVLKDVSFTAKQGEVTALVGPSGGGKTTVSRLAARFWDIRKGKITVGGMDVAEIDPEKLMSLYSIVFQDVTLFDNTIMENIRLGKKGATDEEVMSAARLANVDEFAEKLPDKWNTNIGENGCELSGGERQRISIARAFLKDAPVILLDEATASLDVENETMIQSALSRLIKDKTVLVIAHRMRTVAGADKIVVLADGVVAEQGKPNELYNKNGIYARMVDLQSASGKWKIK